MKKEIKKNKVRGNKRFTERKIWEKELDNAIKIAKNNLCNEMCDYIREQLGGENE